MNTRRASLLPRWTVLLLALCLWVYVAACNDNTEVAAQSRNINPVLQQLVKLSFDNAIGLGAHHMEGTLKVSSEGESRIIESDESYDLRWEGWKNYAYKVSKNDRPTMDVVIEAGKAYQMRGANAVLRDNLHDFHYYLQKTWNLWATAVRPFGDNLELTELRNTSREGRPATEYSVSLREDAHLLKHTPSDGTMRIRFERAAGNLWLDKQTSVPLAVTFSGEYLSIRPSRFPGRPDTETVHKIELTLMRSKFGQSQEITAPEVQPHPRHSRAVPGQRAAQ